MEVNKLDNKKNSVFKIIGASNHSDGERQKDDFYATDPETIFPLIALESFVDKILEPSCGEGHLSQKLTEEGFEVESWDLIDRGFGKVGNFLERTEKWDGDIITNPPYKYAQEFVEKSLELIKEGNKVAMFLKLTFLESNRRFSLFRDNPPTKLLVFSKRQACAKNGEFDKYPSSAVAYGWYVWEKGYQGKTQIEWIAPNFNDEIEEDNQLTLF